MRKIKTIEFYRNIPFMDQETGTPFIKKLFPWHFQKTDIGYRSTIWIEIPFIAAKISILK